MQGTDGEAAGKNWDPSAEGLLIPTTGAVFPSREGLAGRELNLITRAAWRRGAGLSHQQATVPCFKTILASAVVFWHCSGLLRCCPLPALGSDSCQAEPSLWGASAPGRAEEAGMPYAACLPGPDD